MCFEFLNLESEVILSEIQNLAVEFGHRALILEFVFACGLEIGHNCGICFRVFWSGAQSSVYVGFALSDRA